MRKYTASLTWTIALLFLFFLDTAEASFSFCVFKWMGFESCFGCGIGHAIHHALHLQLEQSFQAHILGIPATVGILYSIFYSFPTKQINNRIWTHNKC